MGYRYQKEVRPVPNDAYGYKASTHVGLIRGNPPMLPGGALECAKTVREEHGVHAL